MIHLELSRKAKLQLCKEGNANKKIIKKRSFTDQYFLFVRNNSISSSGNPFGLLTLGLIPLGLISRWAIAIRAKPTWSIFHLVIIATWSNNSRSNVHLG